MYREIVKWPSQSLKRKSQPAEIEAEECRNIIQDLKDTFRVKDGYGLAAPQIGFNTRIITVNPSAIGMDDEFASLEQLIMVNPEIECSGDLTLSKEACFSVPDVSEVVGRYPHCVVTFTNEERNQQTIELTGLAAFCIEHSASNSSIVEER